MEKQLTSIFIADIVIERKEQDYIEIQLDIPNYDSNQQVYYKSLEVGMIGTTSFIVIKVCTNDGNVISNIGTSVPGRTQTIRESTIRETTLNRGDIVYVFLINDDDSKSDSEKGIMRPRQSGNGGVVTIA